MTPPIILDDINVEGVPPMDTTSVLVPEPFTVQSVPSRRTKHTPMETTIAPHASSDMFKSSSNKQKKPSNRWDHILTEEAKSRGGSSLKGIAVHLKQPGIISLGGGLPSSEYFPFESIDMKVPTPPHFSEAETKESGTLHSIGKHDIADGKSLYDLHVSLNYGQATGSVQLLRFVTEHTEMVHDPPYSDWQCCLTAGSTMALEMAFRAFCQRGDWVLSEEYTFATAVETGLPLGVRVKGIKMDAEGLLPDDLDQVLSNWNPANHDGARKPFVLYTVPSGQNPTGATQSLARRKTIYQIAEKHDLYIIEDEPYYFLQMEPYSSAPPAVPPSQKSHADFLKALVPSYLSFDTSGCVLRLDSFSKIIAPGSRVGWITAPQQIVERFIRHSEVSTQNPSGISQIVLFKLLDEAWGHGGFLDWLQFIRGEYTARRDTMLRACEKYLPAEVCEWVAPMAGMFHWICVDYKRHPSFSSVSFSSEVIATSTNGENEHATNGHGDKGLLNNGTSSSSSPSSSLSSTARDKLLTLEHQIFTAAVRHGVLVAKGSLFRAEKNTDAEMFFRTTFAAAPADRVDEAIRRFGEAVREVFGEVEVGNSVQAQQGNGDGDGGRKRKAGEIDEEKER